MSKVTKIDADTVELEQFTTVVRISDLESEAKRRKANNDFARRLEAFAATAPRDFQPYIAQLPIEEVDELEAKIAEYKAL
jgi:hypothetical protein